MNQITDTTSTVTGTTSEAACWNEDGQVTQGFKAAAFVTINHTILDSILLQGGVNI